LTIRFFGSGEPTVAQIKRFIEESRKRFRFRNVLFVAPSGTDEERLNQLVSQGIHHLVGVRRRRDPVAVDVIQQAGRQWERMDADTRIQQVLLPMESDAVSPAEASELDTERYFLIHSTQGEKEERTLRESVVNRALKALEALKQAVETGRLKKPATIMARAESILAERKAYRYISWRMGPKGGLDFWVAERKSSLRRAYEGISLIKTSDPDISPLSAAVLYQVLRRLDNAFDKIRDTVAFRSTHLPLPDIEEQHASKSPGNLFYGHLVVSELAFLLRCKLEKSLLQNRISVSLAEAIEALRTISLVEFRLGKEKRTAVSSGDRTAARILRALGIQALNPCADADGNTPVPPPK
jgi:hypothetical protein